MRLWIDTALSCTDETLDCTVLSCTDETLDCQCIKLL